MAKGEIVDCGDYNELIVRNRRLEEIGRAKFNKRHTEMVLSLTWAMSTTGYPRNIKHRKYLHQLIMGTPPKGMEIDHINGDRMDNRDENLRFVTHTQNMRNMSLSKRNKSGKRGVWFDPVNKAWMAKICVDRKQLFLGRHKTYEQAVAVREGAERRYYGQYSSGA